MRRGESFESDEVAENYRCRPEYPKGVYAKLIELSPRNTRLLDLGCGTAKISRGLSQAFESVIAVDPSAPMLRIAQELHTGKDNIAWVHGLAETADVGEGPFDLIVAAASIHWMQYEVLFPKLAAIVAPDHVFAVVNGDDAHDPPWEDDWNQFLSKWIPTLTGSKFEPQNEDSEFRRSMLRYRDWLELKGEFTASFEFSQTIDEFIRCQHSRDTFAEAKMGAANVESFDQELRELLLPHSKQGSLTYTVQTHLDWGSINGR